MITFNGPINLLLVDDHPENLLALEAVLGDSGYRLVKCGSGEEALRKLLQEEYAVIVLDVQMPGLDGFETARLIKSKLSTKETPIIFISATSKETEHLFEGYSAGCIDYMTKPFIPQVLRSKIDAFVNMYISNKRLQLQTELLHRQAQELSKANLDLLLAKEEAEHAAQAKADFLAMVSHEIRTPLNGVMGMTALLLETELKQDQRKYAEIIDNSGKALLDVINDILDYSKIESGKMEVEEVEFLLEECIMETFDLFSAKSKQKHLRMTYHIESALKLPVSGDLTKVRQVLNNLVGNAVKFTSEGAVHVEAVVQPHDGDNETLRIMVTISDTGVGIPKDKMGELFQPFSQLDSSMSRLYGGTGLGLAICKNLIELMGGTIVVDTERDKGSAFTFTIDVKKTSHGGLTSLQSRRERNMIR